MQETLDRLFFEWDNQGPYNYRLTVAPGPGPGVYEVEWTFLERIERPREFVRIVLERLIPITEVSYVYLWIDATHPDVRPEEVSDYLGLALLCASLTGTHPFPGCQAETPQSASSAVESTE